MANKDSQLYNQALAILKRLHTKYPNFRLGRHLSVAFADYGDLENVSAKEFVFALEKYEMELEIETPLADDDEVDKILKDGMNLDHILDEEEDDDF